MELSSAGYQWNFGTNTNVCSFFGCSDARGLELCAALGERLHSIPNVASRRASVRALLVRSLAGYADSYLGRLMDEEDEDEQIGVMTSGVRPLRGVNLRCSRPEHTAVACWCGLRTREASRNTRYKIFFPGFGFSLSD